MGESPLDRLLTAIDALDADAVLAQFAPDGRVLTVDGRRAEGSRALQALVTDYLATLRSATHRVTAAWHEDNVWLAELDATYELADGMRTGVLPRAVVLREGAHGIADLRMYGAHEHPLADHRAGEESMRIGGRWIPPL